MVWLPFVLGGAFVCGTSFFNDRILRQTYLVGNNMPVSVYGALIIFLLLFNPLLRRFPDYHESKSCIGYG